VLILSAYEEKIYTYEEYLEISDEDRFEYIYSKVYMMGSPSIQHQNVVGNMFFALKNYFKNKEWTPFVAPLDVTFVDENNNKSVVQPDILVVCDKHKIIDNSYKGIPTLVIEVVSPSNSSHDYVTKLDLYLRSGVEEYWILNPVNKNAICYRFENKMPSKVEGYHYNEEIKSEIFDGLNISLKELFD
jgi:Uma2 family endonuclease